MLLGALGAAGFGWLTGVGGCRCSSEREPVRDESVDDDVAPPPEPAGLPLPEQEPVIRVRVLRTGAANTQLTLGSEDQWLRLLRPDTAASAAVMQAPLQVAAAASGWSLVDVHGFRPRIDGFESLQFEPVASTDPQIVLAVSSDAARLDDEVRTYRGGLSLSAQSPDDEEVTFEFINHVHLEDYLPGVLVAELYSHWHPHAFAAQAVAARSYATFEHLFWTGRRRYDVTATQRSQVYHGVTAHEVAINATAHTRGLMLTHAGRVLPAYYSSCCGGLALSAADAYGSNATHDAPPLAGRAGEDVCTDAPVYRWEITRPIEDLTARLVAYGEDQGIEELQTISVPRVITPASMNAQGRPTAFLIDDGHGEGVEIGAERLRTALNFSNDDIAPPERSARSSFFDVAIDNRGDVRMTGRGYGHGVGLCQWGAQTLASQGATWDQIIDWYYPGGEVVSAYG